MKITFRVIILSALLLSVGSIAQGVTEGSGTLCTGVPCPIQGEVLGSSPTPTVTPPPAPAGGGGGGGGGGVSGPLGALNNSDINRDGRVDVLDFNILVVNWGNSPSNVNADINGDGRVDILDFNLLLVAWVQ